MNGNGNGITNQTTLRVRYAETDQMGIAYYANYLEWFEVGRVELMRQMGFEYKRMETEDDCFIAVAEVRCRYKAPARYDDEIVVHTRVKHIRATVIQFGYQVFRREDNLLLTEGETTHVVTDCKLQKKPLPGKYLNALLATGLS